MLINFTNFVENIFYENKEIEQRRIYFEGYGSEESRTKRIASFGAFLHLSEHEPQTRPQCLELFKNGRKYFSENGKTILKKMKPDLSEILFWNMVKGFEESDLALRF